MAFPSSVAMDRAAALLNDAALSDYTYAAQLPYFKIAYDELKEFLEESNVPITNKLTSPAITIAAGVTTITFATTPALPADLIEPFSVYERTPGSSEDFAEMRKVDYLENRRTQLNSLESWTWQGQAINFIGASTSREIKIEYLADTLGTITDSSTVINVLNAQNFLAFRTAALCCEFIGENPNRAASLNAMASGTLDRVLNITIKNRQGMPARRRPFMAAYKTRAR
jgi:hypothetical protein